LYQAVCEKLSCSLSAVTCSILESERAGGLRAFSNTTGIPECGWVEFIDENGGGSQQRPAGEAL
jgi:hypothetical protein